MRLARGGSQLSVAEVAAVVAEAARAKRVVAAHAHGAPGIASAIEAGVHTLEHGSYLNASLATRAKARGMIHVPTITICQTFNASARPDEYDALQWAKGQDVLAHNTAAVRTSIALGLTLATGTDCPGNCAQVAREAVYLNMFGLSELGAIEALTANGPATLGALGMAPRSGRLAAGYEADLVGFAAASPLGGNLSALADAAALTHVFKGGVAYKAPGDARCDDVATNAPEAVAAWMPLPPEW